MIVLVTGTPGSGKTLFVVSKILELQKQFPDRKIYADIDGLQLDGVDQSPNDWRTTPDNSIVIYDEAQQHERFRAGTQANKDEIVQKLQVHRHSGHDIWFITQSPRFLNAFVLDLVGEHYHLHRPYGAKLASVYYWRSVRKQPQSLASRELAENEFLFKYPKELFDVYKSATQHNVKLKIPKKLCIIVVSIVLIAGFVLKMIYSDGSQKMLQGTLGTSSQNIEATPMPKVDNRTVEEREAERRQKFNETLDYNRNQLMKYDVNKPYEIDQASYQYEVTQSPQLAGCAIVSNKCTCYTQQATRINISTKDCKRYMSGDRPFNPFQQVSNQYASSNNSGNSPLSSEQNTSQIPLDDYAKFQEYQRLKQEYQRSQPQQTGELSHGFG